MKQSTELEVRLNMLKHTFILGKKRLEYAASFKELTEKGKETGTKRSVSEDDIAMIMYTSGTTGRPKGTVHTHRGVLCATEAWTRPASTNPAG